ncbi:hypothetical protein [Streptomyces cylindrosporus]|uniref:GNAT family N-acetyltransferase n=1 Tax=Streptomyces cylindrosporus TaxID=2927583 RepID=A0ABS9YH56_9ACTN|nr:hypothetical protein [Streptomyces cylindrosporus]MCI3276284.1 hypothetical protein [Streptomyces cylindrosporus]
MFEIRVICEPDDADRIGQTLAAAFDTGPARQYPARDGKRVRLYFTAADRPTNPESE